MRDYEYFGALKHEIENGGAEAMLYDLLRLDLGKWHPRQIPMTAALVEQKQRSLRGSRAVIESWLQEKLPKGITGTWLKYPNRALTDDMLASMKEHGVKHTNASLPAAELKMLFGDGEAEEGGMIPRSSGSARGWEFPPLHDCRAMWERKYGGKWQWHRKLKDWGDG